jgi:predicted nucleic acid-binding protein
MATQVEFYADSSFLVALYRKDANQAAAHRFMAARAPNLGFSPLNRIELRNALRNLEAVGQITRTERRLAFHQIEEDLKTGMLLHLSVNWTEALRRADELSEQHAGRSGQRTIDLLHVAIAFESGADTFLSFDDRQRKLARLAGLKVSP